MSLRRRDLLTAGCALSAGSLMANVPLPLVERAVAKKIDPMKNSGGFEPTWNSLRRLPSPQWLRDGKFGIYTHWGVYSVHGVGKNVTWYANKVYWQPDSPERKHWEETYGPIDKFGYKDLIPKFTAEKFDAEEWAELFKNAGAKFAGPVAEHHDGFSMWNTKYSEWNAAKVGPKRDIVGELAKSVKRNNMKFVTASITRKTGSISQLPTSAWIAPIRVTQAYMVSYTNPMCCLRRSTWTNGKARLSRSSTTTIPT